MDLLALCARRSLTARELDHARVSCRLALE